MIKLRRYLKPFIFILILAICLLFVQAIANLKLPSLMSDIVNVGIQSSGIESATPKAISENGMNFFKIFMTEDDIKLVDENYELVSKGSNEYVEEYPGIMDTNIYILKDIDDESLSKLDRVFEISTRTFVDVMSELNKESNENSMEISDNTQIDLSSIYSMQPYLQNIDKSIINDARQKAESMDESLLGQSAVVFTKLFYEEIDVDVSKIQTNYILMVGLKMVGVTLIVIASAISVNFISTRTATKIARNIRKDVFKKVQTFSDAEFDKFSTSSLITRTTNDITQVQNIIISGIRIMAYAPVMGIGAIIMILNTNTSMTWILVLACILILILIATIFALAMPKFKKLQELIDNINLVSRENLEGVMVSRAFRTQRYEEKRFDTVNKKLTKTNLFVNRVMVFMMPAMTLIMNGITLLIVWVGAHQIAESALMVGDMMAFMQYAMQVIMSFLMISMIFIMVPRASVSAGRINEVLETDPVIKNPDEPKKSNDKKRGIVEFKNVNFKYTGADEYALENINFIAEQGKTTAFIGSTGSGKSTLVKLIPRFYDVTDGEILVNGVNVKDYDYSDLQKQIAYVPQKASLLSGTIESNLKYGDENASDEFMEKCAEIAQAKEFIDGKEEKYKSPIAQGGTNVSGGQKQRISIARALVKNAPIYIFDDSFSALDFETDSKLRKALNEYFKENTILIVAQRVSTIMNADQIIVLDEGKIVGKGTHKELLENCPTYYEIATSQLEKGEL